MNSTTKYMVDFYIHRGKSLEALNELASLFEVSTNSVYSRLWRAGITDGVQAALYWTDEQILDAWNRLGSISSIVDECGICFYVVKSALQRMGVTTPKKKTGRGKKQKTYYFWKNDYPEEVLAHVSFLVGGRTDGTHEGTIRATSMKDALTKTKGKSCSLKQAYLILNTNSQSRQDAYVADL